MVPKQLADFSFLATFSLRILWLQAAEMNSSYLKQKGNLLKGHGRVQVGSGVKAFMEEVGCIEVARTM